MGQLYRRFFDAYKKKEPNKPAMKAAAEATEEWKRARAEVADQSVFEEHINGRIDAFLAEANAGAGNNGTGGSSGGTPKGARSQGLKRVRKAGRQARLSWHPDLTSKAVLRCTVKVGQQSALC
ncbi:hypothetical protein ONE63_006491 [Megalurothrips usitatus]|uniref:Uncharacterized protein n=1 Tax=Megalurothrips usitatus TaxID=439358 RepID=A0AAV7XXP6_9NEOP|nr:hypothetical protein ONE63_006491 [Megalurothrips usitatus]